MKKRWLLNLVLLCAVASLVAFLYLRPKENVQQAEVYELSNYKLAEFTAISVEPPTKAPVTFAKVDGFWRLTAPTKARADQNAVARILSIIAARSKEKVLVDSADTASLEKFGLTNPKLQLKLIRADQSVARFIFGTHNPINDAQYVLLENAVYLIDNALSLIHI